MTLVEVLLIALILSLDAFAVAMSVGLSGTASARRDGIRLSFYFGFFQFVMPIIGWYVGYWISPLIEQSDHWVAFGLLAVIGMHMIWTSFQGKEKHGNAGNPTKGLKVVMLSLATSMDALAIGLSIAVLRIRILYPSVIIGVVTGIVTLVGIRIGSKINSNYGKWMEVVGGIVLILIGIKIVTEHLTP